MIFDPDGGRLIDSIGWVDRGSLWVYEIAKREVSSISVDDSDFLTLKQGRTGHFTVTRGATVSLRHSSRPEKDLACVRIRNDKAEFSGDTSLWAQVETSVLVESMTERARFVRIDAAKEAIQNIDISWYNADNYDLIWQGLVDCMTLPNRQQVVISVQRSSTLIVIDLERNLQVATVVLAERGGNPKLTLRTEDDFLASDYDTLCRVGISDMKVAAKSRLQGGGVNDGRLFERLFIGDYKLAADGSLVVARPFSGDVLQLDPRDFRRLGTAQVSGQPLVPHLISEHEVLARDWKTGHPHLGRFERADG